MKKFIKRIIPDPIIRRRLPPSAGNSILLTFDDGPHPRITPRVLELLQNHNARAVFFVVGHRAEVHPELLKEIIARGHKVGNHTYSHPNDRIPFYKEYRRDIIRCQKLIATTTGFTPRLFRLARGKITVAGFLAAKSAGLKHILWSREGGEWGDKKMQNEVIIAETLLDKLCPRDIILLHDNNFKVPRILDIILPELESRGIDLSSGLNFLD